MPASAGAAAARSVVAPAWFASPGAASVSHASGLSIDQRGGARTNKWGYTADTATQRIIKFGTGGKNLGSWRYGSAAHLGATVVLATGPGGAVYVGDEGAGRVTEFNPRGVPLVYFGPFPGLRAIAVDPQGDLYVAQSALHRVTEISSGGAVLRRWNTRTLWAGASAGNPTGLAFVAPATLYIATRCRVDSTCAARIAYLGDGGPSIDVLLAVSTAGGPPRPATGVVGLGHSAGGTAETGRDACNNRFVTLDALTAGADHRLYVAGLLWPRDAAAPLRAVGLGPGPQGCTHDGIGATWSYWPALNTGRIGALGVDGRGTLYTIQNARLLQATPATGIHAHHS